MKWSKLLVVLLPIGIVCGALYGCSTKDRPQAGGGGGVLGQPDETCATEGDVRDCHQLVSVNDGVKSCLHAQQVCNGGRWSPCGAAGGTIEATNVGIGIPNLITPSNDELKALAFGSGSPDAAACANPCDPGCAGYDVDAGISLDASADVAAVTGLPSTPPGFVDKLLRDKANSFGSDCERWDTGNNMTGWVHSACQTDYFCSRHSSGGTVGNCVQFREGPNETHQGKLAGTTNGGVQCADAFPDLTIATPCKIGGSMIVPVCNRGAAAVPAGTVIRVSEEVSSLTTPTAPTLKASPAPGAEMAACPTYSSNICSITLAAPLNPGFCVRFSGAVSCAGALNGNKSLYVNADKAVRECVIQPRVLGPPISAHGPTAEQALQYGCANNYTAFNSSQAPACNVLLDPKTITESFSPNCRPDQRPQWGKLAWNATTPSDSRIIFEVRTREKLPDGGFGPWSPWFVVATAGQPPAPDPPTCSMGGPSPCPKIFFDTLADAGANVPYQQDLELRITLNPDSTGLIPPILNNYKLAYSCTDYE